LGRSRFLEAIVCLNSKIATTSHVFYSGLPQESQPLVVAATSTEHEYGAKDIGVKLNAQHQLKPMDGSSRFVERPGPSKLLSRKPKDVYEMPSEPGNDQNYVFNRFLDCCWQGSTVELLVEWSGAEPSWELEANLHRDAHDALLEFWQKQGGHPQNPENEGDYDIYCTLITIAVLFWWN
jgi:hypothetical protein